jgi:hypothetical protein
VLIFVAAVCVLSIVGLGFLAAFAPDPMTKAQENFSSICMHGFMTSLALFIGLAGGRAGHPDYFGQLPALKSPVPTQPRGQRKASPGPTSATTPATPPGGK